MTKLFPYLCIAGLAAFSLNVSFTWDIPVDNQIAMFVFSCVCIGLFFLVLVEDVRKYIKSKRQRPQTF